MSKEKSGDSNEKESANDPNYQHPITLEYPNRKSPSPDIDHLTVKDMKSIFNYSNGIQQINELKLFNNRDVTKYELKGIEKGHSIFDLSYKIPLFFLSLFIVAS